MSDELLQVTPGNAVRLVAFFAQPGVPTNNPNPPPATTNYLPDGTTVTIFGTLFNPPGPIIVILHGADGSQTNVGAATQSATGIYYVDALIPQNAWPGKWSHRWYQQGAPVDNNFLKEHDFEVIALDF